MIIAGHIVKLYINYCTESAFMDFVDHANKWSGATNLKAYGKTLSSLSFFPNTSYPLCTGNINSGRFFAVCAFSGIYRSFEMFGMKKTGS